VRRKAGGVRSEAGGGRREASGERLEGIIIRKPVIEFQRSDRRDENRANSCEGEAVEQPKDRRS